MLAFTSEPLEADMLRAYLARAEKGLRHEQPAYQALMDSLAGSQVPIEVANVQIVPAMHTPQTMQTTLAGWIAKQHEVRFEPQMGVNFFPHGMRDAQGRESYLLVYVDRDPDG